MDEQIKLMKSQLFWQRVCAWACVGIFLVVLLTAVVLVPRVNELVVSLEQLTQQLAAVDWKSLATNMEALSSQLSEVDWQALAGHLEEMTLTAQKSIAALDIAGLNKAVQDLQTAISPLVRLFG